MLKILFLCLALAALPVAAEERQELPAILYTTFQQTAPPVVLGALEDEVDTIMGQLGRHYEWRSLKDNHGNEVSSELAVLTFQGRCDVEFLRAKEVQPGALGWTHVSDGVILPFSDINCDRIREFVQKQLLHLPLGEREESFGRALGRVVAHELYHIFANTAHHGSDGIGKSAYTVQDLLTDEFRFEERESEALRAKDTKRKPAAAPHTTNGAL